MSPIPTAPGPAPAPQPAPAAAPVPLPLPPDRVRIKVDGRDVEVPKMTPDWQGRMQPTTMLQACQLAGIEVPHYCYHPKLPIAGNCRMCLVEFGTPMMDPATRKPVLNEDGTPRISKSVLPYEPGTPRGAIACATPISPGMELYPSSPATRQMREAVLESLLINHPLDCPICDQAGECKLQEYSVQHGNGTSQFVEPKVHKPKAVDLGPRIVLDDERCILCTRCIRFTRDIVGDDKLGIVNRGSYNTIATFPGTSFDNNYTLNTVDICPVGALTSKDFRFQMRVWFLKETKSVCSSCATGCNIVTGSREGRIYRFEPRENEAVNGHWMCDSGRLNYKWAGRPDRLNQVLRRNSGGTATRAAWSETLRDLATRTRNSPSGQWAVVGSSRLSTEELWLLAKLAARLGAITDTVPRTGAGDNFLVNADRNPNLAGARLTGIAANPPGSKLSAIAEGIRGKSIRGFIVFGEDVTRHGIGAELLQQLETLVVCDVLPSRTAELAHCLLPGCAHLEKRGTYINAKNRVQKFMQAVEAPGEARPEWEILSAWLQALDAAPGAATIEGLFNRMAAELKPLAGIEWAKLDDLGVTISI